jgi:OOP family OmpA-OmpF porin
MKKLLLIPALLGTMAVASDYNYEITPVIGYNMAESNLDLKDDIIGGIELQFNDVPSVIKPELSVLYSDSVKSRNITPSEKTDILRIALNGVYNLPEIASAQPFIKAGIGYETLDNHIADNHDGAFIDAGMGVKVPVADNLAVKLEGIYMLKDDNSENRNGGDSNLALLAGLTYSFGKKAQPEPEPAPEPEPEPAPEPEPEPAPEPEPEPTPEPVDGDDDKDGVLNSIDQCPNSPEGALVNDVGCPVMVNLHINFEFDSYEVDAMSHNNIQDFADFLVMYPEYSAKIVGHTDSIGTEEYNQKLSENRAEAVKNLLVEKGADANKITSSGMGETSPTADNSTKEGRAENRRIEAELIKN